MSNSAIRGSDQGELRQLTVGGVRLEYELKGSGEPVLLIPPGPVAGAFVPLMFERALLDGYGAIRYYRRGQAGGTPPATPVTFADHASDAALLLDHLGVGEAHVVGHSTGAAIALQMALDHPAVVRTLALLEPPLFAVPSAAAFMDNAAPSLQAYAAGDRDGAMAGFLSLVSGLKWDTCRQLLDACVPGGTKGVLADADFFFASDLPAITMWTFGPEQAADISQPVLSVLGTRSERLFVEGAELLRSWFPRGEELRLEGAGHLLHMECPERAAEGLAQFFARHPCAVG